MNKNDLEKKSGNYYKLESKKNDFVKEIVDFDIRKSSQVSEFSHVSKNSFLDESYVSKKYKNFKNLAIQKKGF